MPRPRRFSLPGQPHHVIQRGNNRTTIFGDADDYRLFLRYLGEATYRFGVQVHAYVLMTNHVHLLMSPLTDGGISRALQAIGRRYVRRFNRRYERTGTLWEGRYRATVIGDEEYLFTCYRYIELNPVRAGLVSMPEDYTWSSYRANALGYGDPLIVPHERYVALDRSPGARRQAYRQLFQVALDQKSLQEIRFATNCAAPLGGAAENGVRVRL